MLTVWCFESKLGNSISSFLSLFAAFYKHGDLSFYLLYYLWLSLYVVWMLKVVPVYFLKMQIDTEV